MKIIKQACLFFGFMTILLCGVYPMIVMGVSSLFFPHSYQGGVLIFNDQKIGATLIAQEFTSNKFFWARPSAASFNGSASSGSNYSLLNPDYQNAMAQRKSQGLDHDLLTASGSGLDPHISPQAALMQVSRVALARGMKEEELIELVEQSIEGRQLGFLGEERLNVLRLNLSLER